MMYGEINARREIIMDVELSARGTSVTVAAIVDTGFSDFLTLPFALAQELDLQAEGTIVTRLADARLVSAPVYELQINRHGTRRKVTAHGTDGDTLVGMNMLLGSVVTIEAAVGGSVTIEELE